MEKKITIVFVFLVYLYLSIASIRGNQTQMEMKKMLMFFDNHSSTDIV
jgi:hypothetical protein